MLPDNATNDGRQNDGVVDNNNTGNDASDNGNDGIDAAFAKHLDIAIEAQDGPAKVETPAEKTSETDDGENKPSGDSNTRTQQDDKGKEPSASEAGRTLARAKDLTLADGSIVKGGAERRFYEQRETARQEAQIAKNEARDWQQKYETAVKERDSVKETVTALHGMDPQQVRLGAVIVADLQRDPVGTMKKLLAETVAQGYSIEDIGAGVDAAAIQRMIDARLPKQDTGNELTEEQIISEARSEVVTFYNTFPDAQPHDALIARVLQDHPQMTLRDVYFQLKDQFAERGLDWSRSLEENLREVSNTINAEQSQATHSQPLPNGRGQDEEFKLKRSGSADEELDTSDIVKQAMREAGMNI